MYMKALYVNVTISFGVTHTHTHICIIACVSTIEHVFVLGDCTPI